MPHQLNTYLQAKRPAQQVSVWFPSGSGGTHTSLSKSFGGTAYLAFDSLQDAQAHVRAVGTGVVLDAQGKLDATQPWSSAQTFAPQLLNELLTAAPIQNRVNVWFPTPWIDGLGLSDTAPFADTGAYLAFDSAAEASAHVQARGLGVLLDKQGRYDATTTQPWREAKSSGAMLLNPQLTASRTPNKPALWMPISFVSNLGLSDTKAKALSGGAYLAFDTALEAEVHAKVRGFGVVLDAPGTLAGIQPFPNAASYTVELLNPQVKATRTPNKPAVWFSSTYAMSLGIKDRSAFLGGAYIAFNSTPEAQAHAQARGFGVVLDAQGKPEATQTSANVAQELTEQLNPKLTSKPSPRKFSVWIPPQFIDQLALDAKDSAPFSSSGAYLAFDSVQEAVAHAQARTVGVVLDQQGRFDAATPQPWSQAAQYGAQLLHTQLTPTRTPNKPSVWLPAAYMSTLGFIANTALAGGAYLAFDSAQEAQAHAKNLGFGAVLDAQGKLDATQPNPSAPHDAAELLNPQLKPARIANKVNVWFPSAYTGSLGVADTTPFTTGGAYLAFDSLHEAVAHVKGRTIGVVLDAQGHLDTTVPQQWNLAGQYGAQLLDSQLTPTQTPQKHAVWIPSSSMSLTSLQNVGGFPNGAYLAFDSAQEAQAHVQSRTYGVVLDAQGQMGANQPWSGAGAAVAQRLNSQLTAGPTANKVGVWFPPSYVGALGLSDSSAYSTSGAYLAFDSVPEAVAHVKARNFGVVLDSKGQFDTSTPQPWASAGQMGAMLLNPQLTATRTPNKHALWFPASSTYGLGVSYPNPFPQGAYLAFNSAAEAAAHAVQRGLGVVLDPSGAPNATQSWGQAPQYIAQMSNAQLTHAPTARKFNVWFPADITDGLGLDALNMTFTRGAYLAFDTQADAVAHTKQRGFGVVLNPKGDFDASIQNWDQAKRYAAQLLNTQLKDKPTANRFNVWFPASSLHSLGLADEAPFANGAYLAFNSAAEAAAHTAVRASGVVLNPKGEFDTSGPLAAGSLGDAKVRELLFTQLAATRPTQKPSVFFPAAHLQQVGKPQNDPAYPNGAYLPFDSAASALSYTQARGGGVVLDAQGELEPKQTANISTRLLAQTLNAQLKPARTPGKVNVWFPADQVSALGVSDPSAFLTGGAYLAFDSVTAAQRHVESRDRGVILDANGDFDVKSQAWRNAGPYGAKLLNGKLTATKPTQGPYVWFPQKVLTQLGVSDTTAYTAGGAFLSFASLQEAKEHATARDLGLVYDAKGQYDPANQGWTSAATYAPLVAMWPPPALGPEAQTAISGVADIVGVYAKAAKGGAQIVVRTHNTLLNEQLRYELYLTINGTDMKVKDLGTSQMASTGFMHDAPFDISYPELNTILGILQGTQVTPGTTEFAVKVMWPAGHDQGANGAGGRGAHRFPAP